jgi:hypothetical protein
MISIYGHSDDVVVLEGDVQDEVGPGRMIQFGDGQRGVKVTFKYAAAKKSGAVWRASIEQIDEGVPMFPVTIGEAEPAGLPEPKVYSVKVTVDCPPGTPVRVGARDLGKS